MKKLLSAIALTLVLAAPSLSQALTLRWQPVTLGFDGQTLQHPVTTYNIYRCDGTVTCSKANASKVGSVTSSVQFFDVTSFAVPSSYYVTAANIIGESSESLVQRAIQPRTVQGVTLQ